MLSILEKASALPQTFFTVIINRHLTLYDKTRTNLVKTDIQQLVYTVLSNAEIIGKMNFVHLHHQNVSLCVSCVCNGFVFDEIEPKSSGTSLQCKSRFNLGKVDNRVSMCRYCGERGMVKINSALQHHNALTSNVMVWDAITYNIQSLLILRRPLNSPAVISGYS